VASPLLAVLQLNTFFPGGKVRKLVLSAGKWSRCPLNVRPGKRGDVGMMEERRKSQGPGNRQECLFHRRRPFNPSIISETEELTLRPGEFDLTRSFATHRG